MRGARASSSQKYLAALGFTQAMPIDKAMTKTLAATRYWAARVVLRGLGGHQILAAAVDYGQPGRRGGEQEVRREDIDGERIGGELAKQVAGERHDGNGEQEREVPPGQALFLAGDPAEDPV